MSTLHTPNILVLGAGGTGGYFGGRLLEAGNKVTFLVREKRGAQIAKDGLVIESPKGRVSLRAPTVTAATVKPEYDLILLSCKAYDLQSSIDAIAPAMQSGTLIVPLLNGMSHLESLDAQFGKERVMGGSCAIVATLTPDGIVRSMSEHETIVWGARVPAQEPAAKALAECFAKTSTKWTHADNIILEMWEKLTFLSTLAGMTCLMRANIGELLSTDDGRAISEKFLASAIAIAEREGYAPRQSARERYFNVLADKASPITASMLRDLEAGNAVEAAHIVGYMRDKAREHGIDDSVMSIAVAHLQAYQNRRAANRLPNKS
jgi:2-dehydropantoate 2-reductase